MESVVAQHISPSDSDTFNLKKCQNLVEVKGSKFNDCFMIKAPRHDVKTVKHSWKRQTRTFGSKQSFNNLNLERRSQCSCNDHQNKTTTRKKIKKKKNLNSKFFNPKSKF
ncbi:CLUMA_CG018499, isoform A [Clunio marinus]|uniref:CLUMA_CG018499, isoform A n=1 Tax=Clunio marinus TaxID=568069 RepID=A0A1J1J2Z7_9DIPT|nr:CLUMA_CG018499, isoform A [Clunio marinus]